MKTNLSKRMTVTTVFVILLGVLNIVHMLVQAAAAVGVWSEPRAQWHEDLLWLQICILGGYILFGITTNVFAILFMLRSIKLMMCGEFFSKHNAVILWSAAPVYFLYHFFADNMPNIYGLSNIEINFDNIFVSMLLVGFAMIYSTGVRLSEENRLTV